MGHRAPAPRGSSGSGDGPSLYLLPPWHRQPSTPSDTSNVTASNLDFNQEITHPLSLSHLWACRTEKPRQETQTVASRAKLYGRWAGAGLASQPPTLHHAGVSDTRAKAETASQHLRPGQGPAGTWPWGHPRPSAPAGLRTSSGLSTGELEGRTRQSGCLLFPPNTHPGLHRAASWLLSCLLPKNPSRQVGLGASSSQSPGDVTA